MNKQIALSYLRHLLTTAVGSVIAVASAQHIGIAHVTKADLLLVANAVWIAVLPQVRFLAPKFVDLYLKKQFPALGIVLADLESFNAQATTEPTQTTTATANVTVTPVV